MFWSARAASCWRCQRNRGGEERIVMTHINPFRDVDLKQAVACLEEEFAGVLEIARDRLKVGLTVGLTTPEGMPEGVGLAIDVCVDDKPINHQMQTQIRGHLRVFAQRLTPMTDRSMTDVRGQNFFAPSSSKTPSC